MITVTITKLNPRPYPISFALFQIEKEVRPDMVALVEEVPFDIPPNPAANNHKKQFAA